MKQSFVACPSCEGNKLFLTKYDAPLKILKERSWLICKECDYQIQTEEYKKITILRINPRIFFFLQINPPVICLK